MSFLAQLRHKQQANSPTGLQLCYLWRCKANGSVLMTLSLSIFAQGQLREPGKRYQIQPHHLSQPPPFFSTDDVKALNFLININKAATSEYDLSGAEANNCSEGLHDFLERVISGQKSFIELTPGRWQSLSLTGTYDTKPVWTIDSEGLQSLSWSQPKHQALWLLAGRPYAFDAGNAQLCQGTGVNFTTQLQQVANQAAITPEALPIFLENGEAQKQNNDLPLPQILPTQSMLTNVAPVLLCRSQHNESNSGTSELVLGFRYTSTTLCLQRLSVNSPQPIYIWDEEKLLIIEPLLLSLCWERQRSTGATFVSML